LDEADNAPPTAFPRTESQPRALGDYLLGERIGAGGMAEVFEAIRQGPRGFRKTVALKRILPRAAEDRAFVSMFVHEAQLVARLDHPNIVQVFDFGESDGELYLAMELVRGVSLGRLMRTLAGRSEALPIETALYVARDVARALTFAHGQRDDEGALLGLVHRDVSPGNVLISAAGHVKLTDFGIAHTHARERHTGERNLRGKIGYMSPEQVTGQPLDDRSDVFTLSIILAEMLTGETLFAEGSDLDVLLKIRDVDLSVLLRSQRRIPSDIRTLLLLGLSVEAGKRPSALALAETLEEIIQRRRMGARPAERLAQLMFRHELIAVAPESTGNLEPGARPTALIRLDSVTDPDLVVTGTTPPPVDRAQYRVCFRDGRRLGPVAFPELVRLTTTGVLDARTPVARDRDAAVLAAELPELSRIFSTPALQWSAEEIRNPRLRGELSAAILLPLIHSLAANRETGMLYLADGPRRKKIYFVDGRPDFVASSARQEMLGDYLVDHGHCLPMELDMALAVMPHHGGSLGDSLVGLNVMRPVELYRAVSSQVRSRYLEAFRWRTGEWLYVRDADSQEVTYPIEQDAQLLMRDAAHELHPSELERALSPLWEKVLRPATRPPAPLSAYQLPDSWSWAISQANGESTVGSLFGHCTMQSGLDGEDAMRALFLGVSCQLLEAA
jgi:serine/threonine protein kinase